MKGISAVSEALMAIGIIGVSVIFVLVSSDLLGFQTQTVSGATEQTMVEDIKSSIETMNGFRGNTSYSYNAPINSYELTVINNSIIQVTAGGSTYGNSISQNLHIKETTITDSNMLCIKTYSQNVQITAGWCSP